MLKKSITYTDFNGVEVTEDFYFNLTKAELIELEMAHEGGLSESLKKIVAAEDGKRIMEEFKNIILKAYGEKSLDGKKFVKSQHLRDGFESTEAYSELFVSLVTDPEAAAEFISGIMPQDLMTQAQLTMELQTTENDIHKARVKMEREERERRVAESPHIPTDEEPVPAEPPAEPKMISLEESEAMDPAQLQAGLRSRALRVAVTRAEWNSMDKNDLLDKVATGHYFLNEG